MCVENSFNHIFHINIYATIYSWVTGLPYKFLHLVTVGTSVIRNASQSRNIDPGIRDKLISWAMASPRSWEDVEAGNRAVPGSDEFRAVLSYVSGNPRRASAELNAFIGYLEYLMSRGVVNVKHYIVLLGTDTGAGWFSTRILEEYLSNIREQDLSRIWGIREHMIKDVEARRINNLGISFKDGLLNLIGVVKEIVSEKSGEYDRILANLTGGFKPESAAILIAAGLLGIDTVYYIHEVMKEIAEIPVIPLSIDPQARKILENALNDKIGRAEQKLLDKIGLPRTNRKLTIWSKKLLKTLLTQ